MNPTTVPEPSQKLTGLYHEIWTEVDADFHPKNELEGLPLNPRDHLWWLCQEGSPLRSRSRLLDLFTRPNQRGTENRVIPREVAEAYIDQLEKEADVRLDP